MNALPLCILLSALVLALVVLLRRKHQIENEIGEGE